MAVSIMDLGSKGFTTDMGEYIVAVPIFLSKNTVLMSYHAFFLWNKTVNAHGQVSSYSPKFVCFECRMILCQLTTVFLRVTSDGRVYEGNWSNGQAHGKGREVNPDGTVRHDGEWQYDTPVRNC
jgi:hypothetical protein